MLSFSTKLRVLGMCVFIAASIAAGMLAVNAIQVPVHAASQTLIPNQLLKQRPQGQASCAQPPANFDPAKATESEIALYGFRDYSPCVERRGF